MAHQNMSSHLHLEVLEGLSADTPPQASKEGGSSQIPAVHSPGYLLPTDTSGCHLALSSFWMAKTRSLSKGQIYSL